MPKILPTEDIEIGRILVDPRRDSGNLDFIRFAVRKLEKGYILDIRKYTVNGRGHEIPTAKGLAFGIKRLNAALDLIERGREVIKELAAGNKEPF